MPQHPHLESHEPDNNNTSSGWEDISRDMFSELRAQSASRRRQHGEQFSLDPDVPLSRLCRDGHVIDGRGNASDSSPNFIVHADGKIEVCRFPYRHGGSVSIAIEGDGNAAANGARDLLHYVKTRYQPDAIHADSVAGQPNGGRDGDGQSYRADDQHRAKLSDAESFFFTQFASRFNPAGPPKSKDCGPTSLAMAACAFGFADCSDPMQREQIIHRARLAMTGTLGTGGTSEGEVLHGARDMGMQAQPATLTALDGQLGEGHMVILSGDPINYERELNLHTGRNDRYADDG